MQFSEVRGISIVNLTLYILFMFWAIRIIKNRRIIQPNNVNIYIVFLVLIAGFSILIKLLLGEVPIRSLKTEFFDLKTWANPFLFFFVFYNIIDNERVCKLGIIGLIYFLVLTLLPMLLQAFGISRLDMIGDFSAQSERFAGFAEANQYATFLVLLAPLSFTYFLFRKSMIIKILTLILTIMIIIGLFFTGSRGGAISFFVAIGIYIILVYRQKLINFKRAQIFYFIITIIFITSFAILPVKIKQHIINRISIRSYDSVNQFTGQRATIFLHGLKLFNESPIFGHGHGTFVYLINKKYNIMFNSHNDFLLYLVNYGIVGLTILLLLFGKIFMHVNNAFKSSANNWRKGLYASYIAGFSGYIVSMMFVNVMTPTVIFWIYTALIYKLSTFDNNTTHFCPNTVLERSNNQIRS